LKEAEGKAGIKGKGTLGSILSKLGLASVELEADISASGKLSFSKEIVSQFMPSQKLKALLLKLDNEGRLPDLNAYIQDNKLPRRGTSIIFATWLQTDTNKRPETEIERTGQAVLTGHTESYTLEIQASLRCMQSENAWRRLLSSPRFIVGFGTLIGASLKEHFVEIDPIVFAYAEVDE
jgi:hypothetical protein